MTPIEKFQAIRRLPDNWIKTHLMGKWINSMTFAEEDKVEMFGTVEPYFREAVSDEYCLVATSNVLRKTESY